MGPELKWEKFGILFIPRPRFCLYGNLGTLFAKTADKPPSIEPNAMLPILTFSGLAWHLLRVILLSFDENRRNMSSKIRREYFRKSLRNCRIVLDANDDTCSIASVWFALLHLDSVLNR